MAFVGVNFRQLAVHVDGAVDPAGYTYFASAVDNAYPITRGGLTFGATTGVFDGRDRATGQTDARVAGMIFGGTAWRLDLPNGPGTYLVSLAVGDPDPGTSLTGLSLQVRDGSGTTPLITISGNTSDGGLFDAAGNARTVTTWKSSQVTVSVTFTQSFLTLFFANSQTRLASIGLDQAAGPTINTQPSNASVTAPATASFSVSATSSGGTLTYQWQRSTDSGANWANVPDGTGPTSATYTTTATAVSTGNHRDGYRYRCAVSDNNGTVNTSAATLTVTAPPLAVTLDPLVDASNALRTAYTVDKVWAIRVSDNVLVATWANQTTNGSGVLPALTNAGLTAVPHVFVTWDDNATPNNAGAKIYTPA